MKQPFKTSQQGDSAQKIIPAFKIIEKELKQVVSLISKELTPCPYKSDIDELLKYVTAQSGKMLRPALVLLSGKCCGKITDEHMQVAAIFEIIHNATLVHDDVVDQSQMRRGKESINHIYGNESAVLLGDFLLSKVFKMCAELRPEIAKEIASAAAITCQGELNQNLQKHNWQISESEYIEIISDKTAAIFKSCCKLGAFLAGADEQTVQNLADFGLNIGIAFQIADDLLDISGDKNRTGKNIGNDFETAKPTLPLIHFLSSADNKQKAELLTLLESDTSTASFSAGIKQKLINSGSLDYSKQYAEQLINEAINNLAPLPQDPAKNSLIDTAKFILHQVN